MTDMKELKEDELKKVSGGGDTSGVQYFYVGELVEDDEKIRYTIQSFDGVYCGDSNYTVIIEFIPDSVLPFTSFRVGDVYHISGERIHSYKG